MSRPTCRYIKGYGYYLRSHEITCRDRYCDGCQPCTHEQDGPRKGKPVNHCAGRDHCTTHLTDPTARTCPNCIARTRKHLTELDVWHTRDLYAEAIEAGVDSEAAVLAGPAMINPKKILEYDNQHPMAVLGRWDFMVREHFDLKVPTDYRVSIAQAFLDGKLDAIAQDATFDWPWFAAEVAACHAHLADVLHVARRPERGAPCTFCASGSLLVKHYRNEDDTKKPDLTGASDFWRCPSCGTRCSEAEYRMYVREDYLEHAEALTGSQLAQILGVREGTVRIWAMRGKVRKRGFDEQRRQLYNVADVKQAQAERTAQEAMG